MAKTYEVLAVYDHKGFFRQYLAKSEVRFIIKMIKDFGPVEVRLETIGADEYKHHFGK